jgi:hypothetical protein
VTEPNLTMSANRPIVLVLTSDPAFSHEITANWPQDPVLHCDAPEFIVLGEDFSRDLKGSNYDLAIADASYHKIPKRRVGNHQNDQSAQLKALRQSLAIAGKPAILIHSDPAPESNNFYKLDGAILELRREPGLWPAMAGLIGREFLRRHQAELHACEAEQTCAAAQAEATLGRYMVEMRTNINNALTTLLGNAELLALEPGLPSTVQAQADTIRNMALRLHEVFRRFSSIEKELNVAARESGKKAYAAHN